MWQVLREVVEFGYVFLHEFGVPHLGSSRDYTAA
jgi:hypothetical protein